MEMGMSKAMSTTCSKTYRSKPPLLIAIIGPTAIGKSSIALEIARRFGTEVINADSRQFYREMRIGTAKPSLEERQGVPHHFLDDRSIETPLTAGAYEEEALKRLQERFREKNILVMVGGSGLYIDAVLKGLDSGLPPPDDKIREDLNSTLANKGLAPLLEELKKKDPSHYKKVDQKNHRRIIRALEVIRSSDRPYSSFRGRSRKGRPFRSLRIGLWTDREALYQKINERVDSMVREGLLEEVKALISYRDHQILRTVGYQELFPYFDGQKDLETALEEVKQNTRRYAKRQMTWFRRDPEIEWRRPEEIERIVMQVEEASNIKARPGSAPWDT